MQDQVGIPAYVNGIRNRLCRFMFSPTMPINPPSMSRRRQPVLIEDPLDDIQVDLTKLIFSRLFPTILSGTIGLILATALMAYRYHDLKMWMLVAAECVVCGSRLGVVVAFKKHVSPAMTVWSAKQWELRYGIASILYGCMMAIGTLRIFSRHEMTGEILCTIGSLAICAGLASRLGLRPWILNVNGIIILATLIASSLASGQLLIQVGGIMVALYCITFVESTQRNFAVVVEQLRGKRELVQLSQHDSLTGLVNRRQFHTRLSECCAKGAPFAVLFLDLDRFKQVNDTLGHGAGDDLLREVAIRLRATVRETDTLARIGGDEFAILQYPVFFPEDASVLGERINQVLAAPYFIAGRTVEIGVSVGLRFAASGSEDAERNPDTLLSKADGALYRVKAGGKGGFLLDVG